MKLSDDMYRSWALEIVPGAEFDAMFRMPPVKFLRILTLLAEKDPVTVVVSIRDNHGVSNLSFTKERADPNLDRGGDDDENLEDIGFQVNANDVMPEVAVTIEMDRAVEKAVCMMCLHEYVFDLNTKEIPKGSHVTMYIGAGVSTIMYYTIAGSEARKKQFLLPLADHTYHRKEERSMVRNKDVNEYREEPTDTSHSEGGGGNGNGVESANANGDGSGEGSVEGPVDGIGDVYGNVDGDYYNDDYVDDDEDNDEDVNVVDDDEDDGNEADDEAEVQSQKRKRKRGSEVNAEKGHEEDEEQKTEEEEGMQENEMQVNPEHGDGNEEEMVPKNGDDDRGTNSEEPDDDDDDDDDAEQK